MAPIDKIFNRLKIIKRVRNKTGLNNYHKKVFNNLKRFMNKTQKLMI